MDSFRLGVMLVSPLMITGITYYIGLGLLGRLMPQLPVFFFGLPIQITMQIAVLMMTLSTAMMVFLSRFEDAFSGFLVP
jgi:flagellar biosynthetic protein FliR